MTRAPETIPGLSAVADRYSAVLCDVWGVIHNGVERFPAACDALVRFGRERGPVVLISNAPRPHAAVLPQLAELGVPAEAFAALVTSGDATRGELQARAPGPVWRIGPERDAPLYAGIPLDYAGPDDAAFVCCAGLEDDEIETAEDYRETLARAARRGVPFVCANPDRVVQRGDRLIPCAGALADLYEEMGGPVVMAGKPFAPIYDLAVAEASRLAGRPLAKAEVLAVGDGAQTDLLGAQNQGLDCLFVADGIHAAEICHPDGQPDPVRAEAFLRHAGVDVRWISGPLRWCPPLSRRDRYKGLTHAHRGDARVSTGHTFEELEIGMSAEASRTVEEADVVAFAAVSGDHNPVHLDEAFAATTPFGTRIAHGMLSAGYISALIAGQLPGPGAIYLSQALSFRRPVKLGDTVATRVEITGLDADKARATLKTTCTVNGKPVIEGEALIMVPRRGA